MVRATGAQEPTLPPAAPARILVVEDTASTALLIQRILRERGHRVRHVANGALALERLHQEPFDLVVTDLQMPEMPGLELVERMRAELPDPPPIVVQTVLTTADDRERAITAGADDYLPKPWRHADLIASVQRCLARGGHATPPQPAGFAATARPTRPAAPAAPFPLVCIAASTGGPNAVRAVLDGLSRELPAAFVIVVHGPVWMLESYAQQLHRLAPLPVHLAASGMALQPGNAYVAPGDRHTVVDAAWRLQLLATAPEHLMRPAADPLFRSAAEVFGPRAIAVVMTGLGQDGTVGACLVAGAGGRVLVQDPAHCVAPSMPRSVIASGVPCAAAPVEGLAAAIRSALVGR